MTNISRKTVIQLDKFFRQDETTPFGEVFSDRTYYYGGSASSHHVTLWKVKKTMVKKEYVKFVHLPPSEITERSLEDMINEAISEGAWDW